MNGCRHRLRLSTRSCRRFTTDDFYYTSGRWLYNEAEQLAKRHVRFDVPALQNVAADAAGCTCAGITKLGEGLYNKAFSLRMDDGRDLVAKIPHGPGTVASEAATMTFLRTVGVPAPKVFAWSSGPLASNPVGAEYIIMEKAHGTQLSHVWSDMDDAQRADLVKGLVGVEARMAKARLKQYGSLYFRDKDGGKDGDGDVLIDAAEEHGRFIVGPVEGLGGPWNTLQDYFSATASREIDWFQSHNKHHNDPGLHIRLLKQFLSVLPFILPKDHFITYPTLWHTDLHADNIFVDTSNPSSITAIIDWQSTTANPFFMQARFPSLLDCPWPYPWGPVVPRLPENYDHLPPDAQEQARQQYRDIRLKKYYEVASRKFNPLVFRALDAMRDDEDEDDVQISTLLAIVGRTRLDGPVPLRHVLVQIFENWGSRFSSTQPCPIHFSQQEIANAKQDAERWAVAYQEFDALRTDLVGGNDGWVGHDEYHEAKKRYEENKGLLSDLRRKLELVGGGGG